MSDIGFSAGHRRLMLTFFSGDLTRQGQLLFQVLPEDDGPVEEE